MDSTVPVIDNQGLAKRNLVWLTLGQLISATGDHFYMIAMPWLALQMTGSAFLAGTVLAAASAPRAIFMLVGGAVTDRYSAKTLLIVSNGLQGVLMAIFALLIVWQVNGLSVLYAFAFLTGVIDAFGYPAVNTILPSIVPSDDLERGNGFLQGSFMVSAVIGPALVGLLLALFPDDPERGFALAFLTNSLTFLVGILAFTRLHPFLQPTPETEEGVIASLVSVANYIRQNSQLKSLFLLVLVLGLFLTGSITVGLPVLADSRLVGGAKTLGFLNSAFGAGMLSGIICVLALPKPPARISGIVILGIFAIFPAGLILLGDVETVRRAISIVFTMGIANGYITVYTFTWLQRRIATQMLGRIMAGVMFATIGLSPVSQSLIGYFLEIDIRLTFVGVGIIGLLALLTALSNRSIWRLD